MFIGICSRSEVSVYRTIGPLVYFVPLLFQIDRSVNTSILLKQIPRSILKLYKGYTTSYLYLLLGEIDGDFKHV